MAYLHQWKNSGLYREFSGRVSGEEVLESNLKLQGDPRFDTIKYIINDFLLVSDIEINIDEIKRIAAIDKAASLSNSKLKIAMIVKWESLLVWVHMYIESMKGSSYQYKVFDGFQEAEIWCE